MSREKALNMEEKLRSVKALSKIIKKVGSQNKLAKFIGARQAMVNDWVHLRTNIPAQYSIELVKLGESLGFSDKEINVNLFRPDIFKPNIKIIFLEKAA